MGMLRTEQHVREHCGAAPSQAQALGTPPGFSNAKVAGQKDEGGTDRGKKRRTHFKQPQYVGPALDQVKLNKKIGHF